jgi:hypothetical protein
MSPARLSNYGPGCGPAQHDPKFKRVGPGRNSNNMILFGLGPGRAARIYTYSLAHIFDHIKSKYYNHIKSITY